MKPINIRLIPAFCCALALLCACQKHTESGEDQSKISFAVTSLDKTKATAVSEVEQVASMGIFGYSTYSEFNPINFLHTPNLLYNQKATRTPGDAANHISPGEWMYDPVAYWPLELSVYNTFFAYSPHSSDVPDGAMTVSGQSQGGYPSITYTLPSDGEGGGLDDLVDILYADAVDSDHPLKNINRESNDGKVLYQMKHGMAWIAFLIATTEYSKDEISGVYDKTDKYEVTWLSFMGENIPLTSTLNLGTGEWTNSSDSYQKLVYDFGDLLPAVSDLGPNKVVRVVDPARCLMLFPGEIGGENSAATIDLTFNYSNNNQPIPIEYYYYMPVPVGRLVAGHVIVYVINISPEGITVDFGTEHTVMEWLQADEEFNIDIF